MITQFFNKSFFYVYLQVDGVGENGPHLSMHEIQRHRGGIYYIHQSS